MSRRRKVVNYLGNKELLKEIHKSKNTFCEYIDPKYENYDIIIEAKAKITKAIIAEAKKNHAKRLNVIAGDELFKEGWTNKEIADWTEKEGVSHKKVAVEDLVIRVMSDDHIPTIPESGKRCKVNFPPFVHMAFIDNEWKCVGKSHTHKGKFSIKHGRLSNELSSAFMKLVDKYGNRGNWRGYTWLEEMKGHALLRLVQIALQFNEAKSDNPFAWYTTVIMRSFTAVLNDEKEKLQTHNRAAQMSYSFQNIRFDPSFNEQAEHDIATFHANNPQKIKDVAD